MKHRIYRHKPVLFCLILLFLLSDIFLTGCSRRTEPQTETGFYFNTVISITVYHPKDAAYLEDCFSLCDTYEKMLSRTVEGSDICRINHSSGEPVAVSEETARLLEQACNYARLSGGKIDPTVALLDDLWNFKKGYLPMPISSLFFLILIIRISILKILRSLWMIPCHKLI